LSKLHLASCSANGPFLVKITLPRLAPVSSLEDGAGKNGINPLLKNKGPKVSTARTCFLP
jgi:hypothetical protein